MNKNLGNNLNTNQQYGLDLIKLLPKYVMTGFNLKNELILVVDARYINEFMCFLRDFTNSQYKVLTDLTCVDMYGSSLERFSVVYNLLSVRYSSRLRVKALVRENGSIPSVTSTFNAAVWLEREAFDMYGIPFIGNPDLRRILTDYGFEGHPLRKDFPLSGFIEVSYEDSLKRVVAKPIELAQEFRFFESQSAW